MLLYLIKVTMTNVDIVCKAAGPRIRGANEYKIASISTKVRDGRYWLVDGFYWYKIDIRFVALSMLSFTFLPSGQLFACRDDYLGTP